MKKTLLILSIALVATSLSASPSWIGIQSTGSYQQVTTTFTFGSWNINEDHTAKLTGMNVAGTIYPGNAPVGIGFQIGSSKTVEATRGSADVDTSNYPLKGNGGVTAVYRTDLSKKSALELGGGLLFERMTQTSEIGGSDLITTLDITSFLTTADVVFSLGEYLTFVAGLGLSLPLNSKATFTSGGISYTKKIEVTGHTLNAKVGIALGF